MILIKCLRGQQWHNQGSHVSVNESKTTVSDSVFIVCLHACNQPKHYVKGLKKYLSSTEKEE